MKTNLFFLAILISCAFSKVDAQCPSGDVELISQTDVDDFVASYPNCTHIQGYLRLGENPLLHSDITNISGLNNLITIDGYLVLEDTDLVTLEGLNNLNSVGGGVFIQLNHYLQSISQLMNLSGINGGLAVQINDSLTSLHGLDNIEYVLGNLRISFLYSGTEQQTSLTSIEALNNLQSIGGFMEIGATHLTSLNGLNNLTHIGRYFLIYENPFLKSMDALTNLNSLGGEGFIIRNNSQLTSLAGIYNINPVTIGEDGIFIEDNSTLTTCNLPNICEYLSFDPTENPREISGNTGNCIDEHAVLAACGLGINDVENDSTNWQVHYKKENNSFLVQSKGFQISDIQVYNLKGQLLKGFNQLNSNEEEISIFSPDNILIIKVISTDGKSFAKKVMVK